MDKHNPELDKILKLNNDSVLIRPRPQKEIGGIIMPDNVQTEVTFGTVVKTGFGRHDGYTHIDMMVQVGDRVVHDLFAGSEVIINHEKFIFCKEEEVYGRFTDDWEIESIEPYHNRVLLHWKEARESEGGIILPGTSRERHFTGNILAKGQQCYDVRVGAHVLFDQFCRPHKIYSPDRSKRYAMILDDDIYCEVPAREEIKLEAIV